MTRQRGTVRAMTRAQREYRVALRADIPRRLLHVAETLLCAAQTKQDLTPRDIHNFAVDLRVARFVLLDE